MSHIARIAPPAADFALRSLAVLAYAQGFTHWHYKALEQTQADVAALSPRDLRGLVRPGDLVTVSASDGPLTIYMLPSGELAYSPVPVAARALDLVAA